MIPQLDLKRLKLILVLAFFLGVLVSPLFAPLAVGIYNSFYMYLHIVTYSQGEAFDQALFSLVLGSGLILYWIIVSLYEKDPYIQRMRDKQHFPAISPWLNGTGIIIWGCFSLIQAAWHVVVVWPDPFFIGIFCVFIFTPWCIDVYRKRRKLKDISK